MHLRCLRTAYLLAFFNLGLFPSLLAQQYCVSGTVTETRLSDLKVGDAITLTAKVQPGSQSCTTAPDQTTCTALVLLEIKSGKHRWSSAALHSKAASVQFIFSARDTTTRIIFGAVVAQSSPPQALSMFNTLGVHIGLGTYSGNFLANGGLPPALPNPSNQPFEPASIYLAGPGGNTDITYTGQECTNCLTPDPSGEVPITNFYPQKQSVWCWAAVSEMLMENSAAREHHDQCEQASKKANGSLSYCCVPHGGDPYIDPKIDLNLQFSGCNAGDYVPSSLARLKFQVRTAGVLPLYGSLLTLQEIQQQISCKHHLVGFRRSDNVSPFKDFKRFLHPTNHDMIIYGYVGDLLMIYDPGLDSKTKITYDKFQDPVPFRLIETYYEVNKMP